MSTDTQLFSEEQATESRPELQSFYEMAARQLLQEQLLPEAVIDNLVDRGLSHERAGAIVFELQDTISRAKRSRAQKDMLYGALWCVGGIIATAASVGFIFWGAIVFGGIQFFRGVANMSGD